MEAGREFDALVAERVMGLEPYIHKYSGEWRLHIDGHARTLGPAVEYDRRTGEKTTYTWWELVDSELLPYYSTDIAAAWLVWEAVSNAKWSLHRRDDGGYEVMEHIRWEDFYSYAEASTAPLAICLAALRAKGGELPS